jgi:hypothetical protein
MVKECVPILFTKNRKTSVLPSVKDLKAIVKFKNEPQWKTIAIQTLSLVSSDGRERDV